MLDVVGDDGFSPIDDLSLSREILDGLRSGSGPLARFLEIAIHYEAGDWSWLNDHTAQYSIGELYRQAIVYAENALK